jgi:hypothetical protein
MTTYSVPVGIARTKLVHLRIKRGDDRSPKAREVEVAQVGIRERQDLNADRENAAVRVALQIALGLQVADAPGILDQATVDELHALRRGDEAPGRRTA